MGAVRVWVVAAIASITQIALTVAYTSLAFRDGLSAELGLGLAAMFIGMLLTASIVGARSGLPGHVSSPQDGGLAVLSVIAPTIASTSDAPGETLVVLMGLSSLAVGVTMVLLGRSGLGRMIRFLPYPVLAGFLAGTGLVMAIGTVELASRGISGDATDGVERIVRFAVVIGVAGLMTAISRSSLPSERFVPPLVLGSIVAYHLVASTVGIGRDDGAARGWLLPRLPDGALVDADTLGIAGRADWSAVVEHLPAMLPLLLLAPLTVLLYLGALESSLDTDIDVDREFQVIGGAGIVAGVFGSAPAYTQFANTMLVQRMAGGTRVVPVAIGASAILVLALGDAVVGLIPQPIVAGLLGFIAASFVLDWTWDLRHRVSPPELLLTALVALSIPVFGFLVGVGFGLVLTAGWFVVQYSRISGVRRVRDGTRVRSNAFRSATEEAILVEAGQAVLIVELEGFLFFGTGDAVLRTVDAAATDQAGVEWVVIDFTRVSSADSSAVASFGQLVRWAGHHDVELVWVAMNDSVRRSLAPLIESGERVRPDLDRALSTIETVLIDRAGDEARPVPVGLLDHPTVEQAERVEIEPGDTLVRSGEAVDGLFVIESGRVSVLGNGDAEGVRHRQLGPGSVLGEIGLYGDATASATVVADESTVLRHVSQDDVRRLELDDPAAAADLHRRLATIVAERLRTANAAVESFREA